MPKEKKAECLDSGGLWSRDGQRKKKKENVDGVNVMPTATLFRFQTVLPSPVVLRDFGLVYR